jgi:hypothetical protein
MIAIFGVQFAIGLICLVAVLLLGEVGMVAFVPFALYPVFVRKYMPQGPDERELQFFYRAGNFTMIFMVLAILGIYFASGIAINGNLIGDNWHLLSIASILFFHGFSGLLVFRKVE